MTGFCCLHRLLLCFKSACAESHLCACVCHPAALFVGTYMFCPPFRHGRGRYFCAIITRRGICCWVAL